MTNQEYLVHLLTTSVTYNSLILVTLWIFVLHTTNCQVIGIIDLRRGLRIHTKLKQEWYEGSNMRIHQPRSGD